jgi:hypothetical protein
MVAKGSETISELVLPLGGWLFLLNRLDLYDKSRMTGDCHVRF